MNYKVLVTSPAANDLNRIVEYIADRLHNKKAAVDFLCKFDEQVAGLSKSPRLYPLSLNASLSRKGYRKMTISNTNYIALYSIDSQSKTVYVLRIFSVQQNYTKLL